MPLLSGVAIRVPLTRPSGTLRPWEGANTNGVAPVAPNLNSVASLAQRERVARSAG